jgi:hypothetical protein
MGAEPHRAFGSTGPTAVEQVRELARKSEQVLDELDHEACRQLYYYHTYQARMFMLQSEINLDKYLNDCERDEHEKRVGPVLLD